MVTMIVTVTTAVLVKNLQSCNSRTPNPKLAKGVEKKFDSWWVGGSAYLSSTVS